MASVTTKSARSLTAKSPKKARAQVTLTTQATVGEPAAVWKATANQVTFVGLHAVELPQLPHRWRRIATPSSPPDM